MIEVLQNFLSIKLNPILIHRGLLRRIVSMLGAILVLFATEALMAPADTDILVKVGPQAKVKSGESVAVSVATRSMEVPKAVVLQPGTGTIPLELERVRDGEFRAMFEVGSTAPQGLYAVHVWSGRKDEPSAVGKASFRVGNIVADFFIANQLSREEPAGDLSNYLRDFRSIAGNFLIAHNLIIASGALYPSKITKTASQPDVVELLLSQADRLGVSVLLSVSWDTTRNTPYKGRMKEIKAIASELYSLYHHHPSLAGFYSWQEGSGTYYAPFVREFSEHIKTLDSGLLTACAPHIDDPLLASYLSVIEELDIMIFQSAVMASYRPDNRKQYPLRRVRDFSGLGAGAKRLQNKITLTHVELFAYMEKRLRPEILTASYNDIYGQILSAATVTDTDGIALFAYHSHIYEQSKRFDAGKTGRSAVEKGLKLYQTITSEVSSQRNPIALYVPYSDFVIERWNNYFLPALDAFRKLGVPIDIVPYAPRLDESVYPFYPIHMNETVLERLLEERTILVLANVSGFQQTDSDLVKAFVERGGVVIAFGPQIPFGRTYERMELFGGNAKSESLHTRITPASAFRSDDIVTQFPKTAMPAWEATTASIAAKYEDGSAAVLMNKFGKGTVFTILPDASFSSEHLEEMVRDLINMALTIVKKPTLLEIRGTGHNFDIAVQQKATEISGSIVNHNADTRRVGIEQPASARCTIRSGTGQADNVRPNTKTNRIEVAIPKNEVMILKCE